MTQDHALNKKTRSVAIFGGCKASQGSDDYAFAHRLGALLGAAGIEVINGGYGGTMEATSRGAKGAGGFTVGVTCPSVLEGVREPASHNSFLDLVLPAPDMLARIDVMMRLAGGFVVLNGGTGTLCELGIVWEHVSKGFITPRPIVLAGRAWDGLCDAMSSHEESSVQHVHRADSPEQIVEILNEKAIPGTRADNSWEHSSGFNDATTTVGRLREIMDKFVKQRDWHQFHDAKNLAASIAIEAAELMEHFQWLRTDELAAVRDDEEKMSQIREEIADVLAYVLSFAGAMEIDLSDSLAKKMVSNARKYPAEKFRSRFE